MGTSWWEYAPRPSFVRSGGPVGLFVSECVSGVDARRPAGGFVGREPGGGRHDEENDEVRDGIARAEPEHAAAQVAALPSLDDGKDGPVAGKS